MTACEEKIAARIAAEGPIRFSEFMRTALYDRECGYYMRREAGGDPFGKEGDFFTAAQMQPVFGRLMGSLARKLNHECVVDWGAGRGEMSEGFAGLRYIAVDANCPAPSPMERALIFANELFDALPVDLARRRAGRWLQTRAGFEAGRFVLVEAEPLEGDWLEYAERFADFVHEDGDLCMELPVDARAVLERMSAAVAHGHLLVIDYGYTGRERIRFPQGTLMSYRKHRASEDVLRDAGERDITAHVPFDYLEEAASQFGWRRARWESMASLLMHAGEEDLFAGALRGASEADEQRLRLQLKTLLFGMGETFRALLLER